MRRRAEARPERGKRGRDGEPISPFFNPLQGRATEAFRRVATSTARLRSLAGERLRDGTFFSARPQARAALAGGALLLAFVGIGTFIKHAPPKPAAAPAPATVASARPAAPAPVAVQAPPAVAGDTPPPTAGPPSADAPDADASVKSARGAAWARLATGSGHAEGAPARGAEPKAAPARPAKPAARKLASATKPSKTSAATSAATKPAEPKASPPAVAKAAAPAQSGGACVMSVGSKPPAEVWLDDHSLGRRTPLVKYKLACGDHKLALKRTDLDLYQMEIVTLRAGKPFKKVYPLQ